MMNENTKHLIESANSEDGIPDIDAWVVSAVAAIQQQERELEMMTEALRIASTAVESLHVECDRHRQAANEHRNAAMEADLRTQAAVRGEKAATAEVERLRGVLERIAKYPRVSGDELGYEGCRHVAREALKTPNV